METDEATRLLWSGLANKVRAKMKMMMMTRGVYYTHTQGGQKETPSSLFLITCSGIQFTKKEKMTMLLLKQLETTVSYARFDVS